jgi:transposase
MARSQLVDDELWGLVKPLLPDRTPRRTGRPRVSDRAAFTVIVFVLVTGVPWRMVPRQIGCAMGSPLSGGLGSGSAQGCGRDCTANFSAA